MNDATLQGVGNYASKDHGQYDDLLDQGPTNQREEGHHDLMRKFQEDAVVVVLWNLCDYFINEINKSLELETRKLLKN